MPPAASTGTSPARATVSVTSTRVDTHPPCPPASPPCAMITSAPAASASSAWCRSITCCIQRIPASCARATRSAGTPMWKEITFGRAANVAANAASSKGRFWWFTANGRSVRLRRRRHCSRRSSGERRAVPRLPSPPARLTAAARSTCSHGPKGAATTGTVMPSRSQTGVRITGRAPFRYGVGAPCLVCGSQVAVAARVRGTSIGRGDVPPPRCALPISVPPMPTSRGDLPGVARPDGLWCTPRDTGRVLGRLVRMHVQKGPQ